MKREGPEGSRVHFRASLAIVAGALLLTAFSIWSINSYRASLWSRSADEAGLRNAVRLRPKNADYHLRLGRAFNEASGDTAAAESEIELATVLNPYDAGNWLELAHVAEVRGEAGIADRALTEAVVAEPSTPRALWEAANFHLISGDDTSATSLLHDLLKYDERSDNNVAAVLAASSLSSATVLDRILPPRLDAHASYLQRLVLKGRMDDADATWARIVDLHQPIAAEDVAPYYNALISAKDIAQLQRAWNDTLASNGMPTSPQSGELMSNGGFETTLTNAGLGWRYEVQEPSAMFVDTTEAHSGVRSMRIKYDSEAGVVPKLFQFVAVDPAAKYQLSFQAKSEDLLGVSGIKVVITDAYTGKRLASTDEMIGTSPWRKQELSVDTEGDSRLLKISVERASFTNRIRGKLWLDDFSLQRLSR